MTPRRNSRTERAVERHLDQAATTDRPRPGPSPQVTDNRGILAHVDDPASWEQCKRDHAWATLARRAGSTREGTRDLAEALGLTPYASAATLAMRERAGETVEQIAADLRMSIHTVRARIREARNTHRHLR